MRAGSIARDDVFDAAGKAMGMSPILIELSSLDRDR
jgi:hypothetical protein